TARRTAASSRAASPASATSCCSTSRTPSCAPRGRRPQPDLSARLENGMILFSSVSARPLGKGRHSPAGRLPVSELAWLLHNSQRAVAGSYRALPFEDLARGAVPSGTLQVSPKIDGEPWFLVLDEEAILCSPTGRVVSGDIPVLQEAKAALGR